jgi:hypothetical protein
MTVNPFLLNPRSSNKFLSEAEKDRLRRQQELDRAWIAQRDDDRFEAALRKQIDPIGYGHWNED